MRAFAPPERPVSIPLCASSEKRLDVVVAKLRFWRTAPFTGIVDATGEERKAPYGRFSDKKRHEGSDWMSRDAQAIPAHLWMAFFVR